jgi:DNA repair protein RecN (Recombination protein N)
VEAELEHLKMNGARFKVAFEQVERDDGVPLSDGHRVAFDANGLENVEFLVAPNLGEGLKPLVKIASGGETSRLMLAIKNVLAQADQVPTLIFDEIDQGIGGRVGAVVGRKLWELARQHQVLCVTHLPQLAAFGEAHLRVQKQQIDGRTVTQVASMSGDERVLELAQMLGEVSEGTRRSAQELLETARQAIQTPLR